MADELLVDGKKLSELKLVEIRSELGKRNLPKKGNKQATLKRLEKALLQEKLVLDVPQEEEFKETEIEEVNPPATVMADTGWSSDTFGSPVSFVEHVSQDEEESCKIKIEQGLSTSLNQDSSISSTGNSIHAPETMPIEVLDIKQEIDDGVTDISQEGFNFSIDLDDTEDDSGERVIKALDEEDHHKESPTNRLDSIASNIESSYPREEELIYEGDMEHESTEEVKAEDEEKDVLIVDVNSKELDLDESQVKKAVPLTASVRQATLNVKAKHDDANKSRTNLWISGLASTVSAADLKTLLSSYGQVTSVKVVAKASCKSERFGFVVMGSGEQCEKCIKNLNGTELKGKIISLEFTKSTSFGGKGQLPSDPAPSLQPATNTVKTAKALPKETKPTVKSTSGTKRDSKASPKTSTGSRTSSGHKTGSSDDKNSSNSRRSSVSQRMISLETQERKKDMYKKEERHTRSRSPRNHGNKRSSPKDRIVSHISPSRHINSSRRGGGSPHRPLPPHRPHSPLSAHRPRSPLPSRRPHSPLTSPRPRSPLSRRPPLGRLGGTPPPRYRLGSPPPPRHLPILRSPPPRRPASPPLHRLGSPPHRLGSPPRGRDLVRPQPPRDVHHRLGGRMLDSRGIDLRIQEDRQRMMSERARERAALRQEVRIEHAQKEQQLLRQLQDLRERESEGREALSRQRRDMMELQKTLREREEQRERELKAIEIRERERNAILERQREKEIREKVRMELQHSIKEKEANEQREKKALEKVILDNQQKLKEQEEKLAKYREELNRRKKEEEEKKQRELRSAEEEKERDNKGRAQKRPFNDDYSSPGKRSAVEMDQSIFGRLGGRDTRLNTSSSQSSNMVKETHISPNLTYRRYETSKAGRPMINNPYSQNQSRGKPMEPQVPNNYPQSLDSYQQTSHYIPGSGLNQYRSDPGNVGYGTSPFNASVTNTKAVSNLLLNHPDILTHAVQALNTVHSHTSSTPNPSSYSQMAPYGNSRLATPADSAYSQPVRGTVFNSLQQSSQGISGRNAYSPGGGGMKRELSDAYRQIPAQSMRGGPSHNYKRN